MHTRNGSKRYVAMVAYTWARTKDVTLRTQCGPGLILYMESINRVMSNKAQQLPGTQKHVKYWTKTTKHSPKSYHFTYFWGPGSQDKILVLSNHRAEPASCVGCRWSKSGDCRYAGACLTKACCPKSPIFFLGLQVCKEYILWGLKYLNRTYFGLFGATGVFGSVLQWKSCRAVGAAVSALWRFTPEGNKDPLSAVRALTHVTTAVARGNVLQLQGW